jgi:ubiquinone/menaquinone biosynthesis C-methylase UbiE
MTDTYQKKDTAERYDSARELPDETAALWMNTLAWAAPLQSVTQILDLGGGTGRFAKILQKLYQCPVITIDPSREMLKQGLKRGFEAVSWICGSAEHIPLAAGSMDLVWMSQVFHHLEDRVLAFQEISRVLKPDGVLVIRNGTRENDAEIEWYKCFPEAVQLDKGRIPNQSEITGFVSQHGFRLVKLQTIYQLFASSHAEYYEKISRRGLSSLISISDEAFNLGVKRLKEWTESKLPHQAVYEPVDIFVFRKKLYPE